MEARERLERVFTDLSKEPFARIVPAAPRERQVHPGRSRIQGALNRIGRTALRAGVRPAPASSGPAASRNGDPESAAAPKAAALAGDDGTRADVHAASMRALALRLDRIERTLEEIKNPLRPTTSTRDLFREWIRDGHWENVRFGDYVRLRRSGRL